MSQPAVKIAMWAKIEPSTEAPYMVGKVGGAYAVIVENPHRLSDPGASTHVMLLTPALAGLSAQPAGSELQPGRRGRPRGRAA